MQIEEIVRFTIERVARGKNGAPDYLNPKTYLWHVDMPRWQWKTDNTEQRLNWILNRFQYQNYGHRVQGAYSFFDKKSGLDTNLFALKQRLKNAKAQFTKKQNQLDDAVKLFKPTLFITNIEQVEGYRNAMAKIELEYLTVCYYTQCVECEEKRLAGIETTFPDLPTHLHERDAYFRQQNIDRLA